jgi:hypothetical protein
MSLARSCFPYCVCSTHTPRSASDCPTTTGGSVPTTVITRRRRPPAASPPAADPSASCSLNTVYAVSSARKVTFCTVPCTLTSPGAAAGAGGGAAAAGAAPWPSTTLRLLCSAMLLPKDP